MKESEVRSGTAPGWSASWVGNKDAAAVLGDISLLAMLSRTQVKGNLVSSRARYVREEYGAPGVARVAEALSPQGRELLLNPPLAFEWCSFAALAELDYRVVTTVMGGSVERMKHFGGKIAAYDLPFAYRVLFKIGSPSFVIERLPSAYGAYFRPGSLRVSAFSRRATVYMDDIVYPRYMCEFGFAGWFREAITLSGGSQVASLHSACRHRGDARCQWDLSWR